MAVTVLDELRRNGIDDIVVAPGSRSAALSMAALSMGFDVHVEIDERSIESLRDQSPQRRLAASPGTDEQDVHGGMVADGRGSLVRGFRRPIRNGAQPLGLLAEITPTGS